MYLLGDKIEQIIHTKIERRVLVQERHINIQLIRRRSVPHEQAHLTRQLLLPHHSLLPILTLKITPLLHIAVKILPRHHLVLPLHKIILVEPIWLVIGRCVLKIKIGRRTFHMLHHLAQIEVILSIKLRWLLKVPVEMHLVSVILHFVVFVLVMILHGHFVVHGHVLGAFKGYVQLVEVCQQISWFLVLFFGEIVELVRISLRVVEVIEVPV